MKTAATFEIKSQAVIALFAASKVATIDTQYDTARHKFINARIDSLCVNDGEALDMNTVDLMIRKGILVPCRERTAMTRYTSYVLRHDLMIEHLTAKEILNRQKSVQSGHKATIKDAERYMAELEAHGNKNDTLGTVTKIKLNTYNDETGTLFENTMELTRDSSGFTWLWNNKPQDNSSMKDLLNSIWVMSLS